MLLLLCSLKARFPVGRSRWRNSSYFPTVFFPARRTDWVLCRALQPVVPSPVHRSVVLVAGAAGSALTAPITDPFLSSPPPCFPRCPSDHAGVPVEHFLNRTPFFCEAHLNSKKAAAILREEAERKERAKLSRRYSDVLENIVRDTEAQEAASLAAAAPANAASTAAAATNSPAASSPRSSSRSRSRSRSTWSPSKGADDSTSVGRFNLPPAPHNV